MLIVIAKDRQVEVEQSQQLVCCPAYLCLMGLKTRPPRDCTVGKSARSTKAFQIPRKLLRPAPLKSKPCNQRVMRSNDLRRRMNTPLNLTKSLNCVWSSLILLSLCLFVCVSACLLTNTGVSVYRALNKRNPILCIGYT